MSEMKIEDIVKSLRICAQCNPYACAACVYSDTDTCYEELCEDAAGRMERYANAGEMVPDDERIMQQAIETYGVQAQCDVAVEEMAELTKAIMKLRRVADDYGKTQAALENLLEEIADVDIMIDQLKIMWGPRYVEEYRRKKLERLAKRLEDKHE